MNPIYSFELSTVYGGSQTDYTVYPLYRDDLAKDYEIEQNEKFYRAKLSGKMQFVGLDYDIIDSAKFETQFLLNIYASFDNGVTYDLYWRGQFFKTDGTFNANNKVFEVTPSALDEYTEVLAGMDKEFNLTDLKPEIHAIGITKRPMIQIYVAGESVISCFMSGMAWEQDANAVDDDDELTDTYHFALTKAMRSVQVEGIINPDAVGVYYGDMPLTDYANYSYSSGAYKFQYRVVSSGPTAVFYWEIVRVADNVTLWQYFEGGTQPSHTTGEYTLNPVAGTGATGTAKIFIMDSKVYARYVLDVEEFGGIQTAKIPDNDIVQNNRNYRRVIGYDFPNCILFSNQTTESPTEWGIKQPGIYYVRPFILGGGPIYPVGRSHWGETSIWFTFSSISNIFEPLAYSHYIMRDANPISSVISVLLAKIAPGITHEPTVDYSQFLYDNYNPISGDQWHLYLTQKTNILAGIYSEPAQKTPITLKMVTDMLRDCFAAYWYIEDSKFKIEHLQWFKNGGRYIGTPVVSHDLTVEINKRNGKNWAYQTDEYDYEKPTMPERYQFGWMDEVTSVFEGYPIEVKSKFVQGGNIEEKRVSNFTSDVDYMLLNPGGCSKDGYALMAAVAETEYTQMNYNIVSNILTSDKYPIIDNAIKGYFSNQSSTQCKMRLTFYAGDIFISQTAWYPESTTLNVPVPSGATDVSFEFTTVSGAEISKSIIMLFIGYVSGIIRRLPFSQINLYTVAQNAYMAFAALEYDYLLYDMPAYPIEINGQSGVAMGIQRNKRQTIKFPVNGDLNPMELIKTNLGNGQIQKISINLSNRNANATLAFDTYKPNE